MGSHRWEGNDLKAPNERTPYLSPSGEPLGTQAMCDAVLQACGCIRIYTLAKQVSEGCVMLLLENIIPRFGIENIDSDNGGHFTASVLKGLMKAPPS
jgi:hypothetical protein